MTKLRLLIALATAMALHGPMSAMAAVEDSQLPASWYQLPEDTPGPVARPQMEWAGKKKLLAVVERIFQADADAFESVPSLNEPTGRASDEERFHLAALNTQLAVSVQGVLAPISLKGTAAVQVFWRKKSRAYQAAESAENAPVDLQLSELSTRADLHRQIEPMIRTMIEAKKVKDGDTFRKELYEVAERFYDLTRVLSNPDGRPWWVSRFRLDVSVDASGKINPAISVGGEIKLRFEWFHLMPKTGVVAAPGQLVDYQADQEKFRAFVQNMADDAEEISYDASKKSGFYPNLIRLGLGFNAHGNFGVVKFGGGVVGYLYFSTPAPKPIRVPPERRDGGEPIPMLEISPAASHLAYARANKVLFEATTDGRGLVKDIIYKIDRRRFKRGLQRSVDLSTRIAERANHVHLGKWYIHELRPSFELSVGGDFKVVQLAGVANMELSFLSSGFPH